MRHPMGTIDPMGMIDPMRHPISDGVDSISWRWVYPMIAHGIHVSQRIANPRKWRQQQQGEREQQEKEEDLCRMGLPVGCPMGMIDPMGHPTGDAMG